MRCMCSRCGAGEDLICPRCLPRLFEEVLKLHYEIEQQLHATRREEEAEEKEHRRGRK